MKPVSFIREVSRDELQTRVDAGTHTPEDQVYLLNQAADIALVSLMELSMKAKMTEDVAETVADCLSLIILSAPEDERDQVRDEIMGLYKPEV